MFDDSLSKRIHMMTVQNALRLLVVRRILYFVSKKPPRHTKTNEAKLKQWLQRQREKLEKERDCSFMEELEEIYSGRHEGFNRLPEGESTRRAWRTAGSVFPDREADLLITKKGGRAVVTIHDIPVPDEKTKIEMKKKDIEEGNDIDFNELGEGKAHSIPLGHGEDIWHVHELVVTKKDGKPVFSVRDAPTIYGTRWG